MATLTGSGPAAYQHRNVTLGIMIASGYRGQGYGTEAINWTLDWAFTYGAQHRVSLSCFGFNERALRLYDRLGFVREGLQRERCRFGREWYDEIFFGMLESDWESVRSHVE